jgi:hypothetical protein
LASQGLAVHSSVKAGRRSDWANLSDAQLLHQCLVDTYRASGPGGQKRNKTSSAVRLRHPPSGLMVIAEESRSQHENRTRALRRMRQALCLHVREEILSQDLTAEAVAGRPEWQEALESGRLRVGVKNARFWPAVGVVLDVLLAVEARVGAAAQILGVSTGNLVNFLQSQPRVWQEANQLRRHFGHPPLVG